MRKIILLGALLGIVCCGFLAYFALPGNGPESPEPTQAPEKLLVRKSAVAGRFYPASPEELTQVITQYLNDAPFQDRLPIRGLVCPHAGYIYSGPVAAYGYRQVLDCYDTVILLGPSHYVAFQGASIPDFTHYETPLGLVPVSGKAVLLREQSPFISVKGAHTQEHSLEVQLPFLQTVLTDFEIIPIVLGAVNPRDVASALLPFIDEKTLIIASSDLSHYHSYEDACVLDTICTQAVPLLEFEAVKECEACGLNAVLTLMYVAEEMGWEGELLDYRNSGDTAGDKERVVGYMAVAFYGTNPSGTFYLNEEDQAFLLQLARETLTLYLQEGKIPEIDESEVSGMLKEKRGCFVTLNKGGMLRGCIGNLTAQEALYRGVMENAINAAVRDPRFPPVTLDELEDIEIEISVLTPPAEITYGNTEELIEKIRGKGVIIQSGYNRATFLPQVWEQLPRPEEFLSHLCLKAGLPSTSWREGRITVSIYTAQVFSEIRIR
ncbi:MAG: AmmeMemoRadiSam system protein B [Theionarchaea archaeon]|nr:AmmeMemoRadiSam system protein B [Theionarchaea archaeon]